MSHRHFIVHKPFNFLSQFVWVSNKKKQLLGELHDFPEGTMAIGRLDKDSEGLLFLTTDGKMSEWVRSSKVEKEYYVQVDGLIDCEALDMLRKGVEIGFDRGKYMTRPAQVFKLLPPPDFPPRIKKIRDERHGPTCWISITLKEGKFRQVRKMTAAVGFPTLRLVRVRIGNEWLTSMKSGEVKEVNSFDL